MAYFFSGYGIFTNNNGKYSTLSVKKLDPFLFDK